MFAVLQKLINQTNPRKRPPEDVLSAVPSLFSLSPAEREVRLKSYFKFVMVRNPFERIVSVYRNKVSETCVVVAWWLMTLESRVETCFVHQTVCFPSFIPCDLHACTHMYPPTQLSAHTHTPTLPDPPTLYN